MLNFIGCLDGLLLGKAVLKNLVISRTGCFVACLEMHYWFTQVILGLVSSPCEMNVLAAYHHRWSNSRQTQWASCLSRHVCLPLMMAFAMHGAFPSRAKRHPSMVEHVHWLCLYLYSASWAVKGSLLGKHRESSLPKMLESYCQAKEVTLGMG